MASIGSSAPETNDSPEAPAAWTGLTRSVGSMCSSASRWAFRAPRAVSSVATARAVAAERPFASYRAVSSASSASGLSASSSFSCVIAARSLSRWLETDTYSPRAIDTAPPTRPASPAVKMAPRSEVAPATPITMAATETIPSLAPSTPARNQFSRLVVPAACGSRACVGRPLSAAWT